MQWFVDLLAKWKIPAAISAPLFTLISAIIIYFTTNAAVKVPTPVNNQTDNYYVMDNPLNVVGVPAGAGNGIHPVLTAIARSKAAGQYAKDKDIGYLVSLKLCREVPDADITAEMVKQGIEIKGAMVVGGPLQNLLQWIKDNPETVQMIIKIIIMLLPLFADNPPMPDLLAIPPPDIRVCQVPYPLAWRPELALAV